jgi:chromosome partitioning protein
MPVIAVANQKGGVGKTTTAVNVAVCLHSLGHRVLLCDLDAQGHVAVALGIEIGDDDPTILDLLKGSKNPDEVKRSFRVNQGIFDLWPAAIDLSHLDQEFAGKPSGYYLLREAIDRVRDQYDFIIVDCPPFLGLATTNALAACDGYLVPVMPGLLSLDGIRNLEESAGEIRRYLNPGLRCLGVVLTKADVRTRLTRQTMDVLREAYEDLFIETVIYEWVRYANAVSDGVPIEPVDDEPYMILTKEVLRRVETVGGSEQSA